MKSALSTTELAFCCETLLAWILPNSNQKSITYLLESSKIVQNLGHMGIQAHLPDLLTEHLYIC